MATPQAVEQVLAAALARHATLGRGSRAIAVDGPAGAGKTTLADQVADVARSHGTVAVVHLDDLYDGWRGVLSVNALVATVLRCLHAEARRPSAATTGTGASTPRWSASTYRTCSWWRESGRASRPSTGC